LVTRLDTNVFQFREQWLFAAIERLSPLFKRAGSPIPEAGRAAIGFTSKGTKGRRVGECWASVASKDRHFEIFIRPDISEPVQVLGILTHELVHAALPVGSGHGPAFKALAVKIGLTGKMRQAIPGPVLEDRLHELASDLGPLPHASLNIEFRESAPRKKQKTHMLKAYCEGVMKDSSHEPCDYIVRVTSTHAKKALPICGVHEIRMKVDWPDDNKSDGEINGELE
jgi:hypothetical protein